MEIPQCEKLKDLYEDCSKDLKKQFWKDFNVKDFFACDHLFQVLCHATDTTCMLP